MSRDPSEFTIAPLPESKLADATRLLSRSCQWDRAHFVANEKLFGDAAGGHGSLSLGAFEGGTLVGIATRSHHWIRLLAVLPSHRGAGIGSALLGACESHIAKHSPQARIMDQPGNYLSPGIDKRNTETIAWLSRRGFSKVGKACNLLIRLHNNPLVSVQRLSERKAAAAVAGYNIVRISRNEVDSVAAMVEQNFSAGWAFEIRRAAALSPAGVFLAVAKQGGAVVAFAAHDGNNQGLGSFGPAGTLDEHRGKGLGAALLLACLLDIQEAGHAHAEVAWIGPRVFYDKIAGIESERHFCTMTKTLTQGTHHD